MQEVVDRVLQIMLADVAAFQGAEQGTPPPLHESPLLYIALLPSGKSWCPSDFLDSSARPQYGVADPSCRVFLASHLP